MKKEEAIEQKSLLKEMEALLAEYQALTQEMMRELEITEQSKK